MGVGVGVRVGFGFGLELGLGLGFTHRRAARGLHHILARDNACQPEVGHLDVGILGGARVEDILGLEVSVHDLVVEK